MNRLRMFALGMAAAAACLLSPITSAAPAVADISLGTVQVEWQPTGEFAGMTLRVSGPLGVVEQSFAAGENPLFDLSSLESVADGLYTWEIVAAPRLDEGVRRAMAEARAAGDGAAEGRLRASGALPNAGDMVQSGSFRVVGGAILQPTGEVEGSSPRRQVSSEASGGDVRRITAEDQVIPDDLIVQRSLCVGFDCINNEDFGFDTIRLKENNTRIKFLDTSAGSFPSTDWQLTANDSASGGQNKFSIEDITGVRVPFTIEATATTNSIYVDSTGRVGFRTSTPVLDLHVSTGNTPGIRLEQNNSGGFTAQTWDIAGNEANFFVRSVTTGSQLPFRIRPGAPSSSIDIAATGDVGIGTASPDVPLHVLESTGADASLFKLENNGGVRFEFENTVATTGGLWQFINTTNSGGADLVIRETVVNGTEEFRLTETGNLTISGQLITGGPQCGAGTPCDGVFSSGYTVESIAEHSAEMWSKGYLPAVGPTLPGAPMNVSEKTGRMLNELEKAHIYIEQLDGTIQQLRTEMSSKNEALVTVLERLAAVEATLNEAQ